MGDVIEEHVCPAYISDVHSLMIYLQIERFRIYERYITNYKEAADFLRRSRSSSKIDKYLQVITVERNKSEGEERRGERGNILLTD